MKQNNYAYRMKGRFQGGRHTTGSARSRVTARTGRQNVEKSPVSYYPLKQVFNFRYCSEDGERPLRGK